MEQLVMHVFTLLFAVLLIVCNIISDFEFIFERSNPSNFAKLINCLACNSD